MRNGGVHLLKEARWTNTLGSIDDLIWDDEIAWFNLLAEGADS